jgi:enamine deaminase RidA (YjgF/YER057c/UK114 family)
VILGAVERRLISSGSTFEERWGYSRAVVSGSHVYVAGTAPVMQGNADPPTSAYDQMRRCIEIVEAALAEAGAGLGDVVRTRVYMTDAAHAAEAMRAHGETFAPIRPACTGVVCGLLDERWLVELEVEALVA